MYVRASVRIAAPEFLAGPEATGRMPVSSGAPAMDDERRRHSGPTHGTRCIGTTSRSASSPSVGAQAPSLSQQAYARVRLPFGECSVSRKAQLEARVLRGMECDSDEARRSARQHGSGCRKDGLACTARPMMVSLRRRTGGSCHGGLRNRAPSIAATLSRRCIAPGDEFSGRPPSHTL
jgi:hypothetical protein